MAEEVKKPEEIKKGFKPNASEKIASAVRNAENYGENNPEIIFVKNMEEAVDKALEKAVRGDKVSLCPACTAFDMYLNFEVRGNYYKEIVLGNPAEKSKILQDFFMFIAVFRVIIFLRKKGYKCSIKTYLIF